MHNKNAVINVLIITALLLLPPSTASLAETSASNSDAGYSDDALPTRRAGIEADASLTTEMPIHCPANQTLYACSMRRCCQSQSEVLVEQLQQIKSRFRGVGKIIKRDHLNIKNTIQTQLDHALKNIETNLGEAYVRALYPVINDTLHNLSDVYLGEGNTEALDAIIDVLARDVLRVTFTEPAPSKDPYSESDYPRNIKGINIFWELNTEQKKCVIEYMIRYTSYGATKDKVLDDVRNNTQSTHKYMSLLGTMVRIIDDMVNTHASTNCIEDIVKMQQCSLCTEKPVCDRYYHELLSRCVPQLEKLYYHWPEFMSTMSFLTRQLCQQSPNDIFTYIDLMLEFIREGKMENTVYEHGVLAYMKCVQPDYHKRSITADDLYREEAMMSSDSLVVPSQLEPNRYTYRENNLFNDMKISKRSTHSNVTGNNTLNRTPAPHPTTLSEEEELSLCREKLGLSFPPLELGQTWLNITRSEKNADCWNGTEVGSYFVDREFMKSPQHEAFEELEDKICRYTPKSLDECREKPFDPPPNNSIYKTSITKVLASLTASLLYCCC